VPEELAPPAPLEDTPDVPEELEPLELEVPEELEPLEPDEPETTLEWGRRSGRLLAA
jgi:hypothetical protein